MTVFTCDQFIVVNTSHNTSKHYEVHFPYALGGQTRYGARLNDQARIPRFKTIRDARIYGQLNVKS